MYTVPAHMPQVHRNVLRFRRRLLASVRGEVFPGMGERSVKGFLNGSARLMIRGHEKPVYNLVLGTASKLTGREIIGCGEESLVTANGDKVIKFATRPTRDVGEIVDVLRDRLDRADRYIGEWVLPTQFEIGAIQRGDELVPSAVVMEQERIDFVEGRNIRTSPDFPRFAKALLALTIEQKISADLYTGTDNLVVTHDGGLCLVDTPLTGIEQSGEVGLLSPNMISYDEVLRRTRLLVD